jgi:phage-related tail protein
MSTILTPSYIFDGVDSSTTRIPSYVEEHTQLDQQFERQRNKLTEKAPSMRPLEFTQKLKESNSKAKAYWGTNPR